MVGNKRFGFSPSVETSVHVNSVRVYLNPYVEVCVEFSSLYVSRAAKQFIWFSSRIRLSGDEFETIVGILIKKYDTATEICFMQTSRPQWYLYFSVFAYSKFAIHGFSANQAWSQKPVPCCLFSTPRVT